MTDMQWVRARLSEQQLNYSYVWKTLLLHEHTSSMSTLTSTSTSDGNVSDKEHAAITPVHPKCALHVAGGSDAPIESPNPFTGMYDAMFRSDSHRQKALQSSVFKPEECLSFSQALWIYTVGNEQKICFIKMFVWSHCNRSVLFYVHTQVVRLPQQ